jgi:uncharacterized repeat protein (TIGR01451 family)
MSRRSTRKLAAAAALGLLALAIGVPIAAAHPAKHAGKHSRYAPLRREFHRRNLALRLSGSPATVNVGQQVTYTATVVNTGRRRDANAGFRDRIPAKASLVSTTPTQGSCSNGPAIVCNLGSLARGASATITIVVTANQPGWMLDSAWVSTNPPGGWMHYHAVRTFVQGSSANVDLQLTGSPGTVNVGQQVTYTATVTNNGSGPAASVAFQDLLPGKASFGSASPSQGSCSGNPVVLCNLGSLAAGASATVTIVVTANQPGPMTDNGWVSSNPPGHWQHHRAVTTQVVNVTANVDLRLTGSPGTVGIGDQVTYTATIGNNGNAAASTVAFQDLLPGKASLVVTNPSQGSCSGNPVVVCSLGSLAAGASATVTVVVTANQPGLMIDNGWVSTSPPGNWQHHRTVQTNVRDVHPDLALRLSGSPGSVTVGQQVTYTATVTNTGNGTDTNAGFQDELPANTTVVSVTPSQGTCSSGSTVTCSLGSLDKGDSATVTIVVTPSQPGMITDHGWVSINPPGGWEHEHSVTTQVTPAPTPAVTTTTTGH